MDVTTQNMVDTTNTMISILMFALVFINIFTLIANFIMFKVVKQRQVLGLIPMLNDFILFRIFWSGKFFAIYIISQLIYFLLPGSLFSMIAGIIIVITILVFYDKVRKGFDKGWFWLFGLILCYPVFLIILAKKGTLSKEISDKCEKLKSSKIYGIKEIDSSHPYFNPLFDKHDAFLWGTFGALVPYVGLFLYMLWRHTKPQVANSILKGMLTFLAISLCVYIFLAVLFFVAAAGVINI